MARPPRISIWLKHDQVVTYFVTMCVEDRRSVLANPAAFRAIQTFCRANANWRTIAAVAMPDHFHALVCPLKDREAKITQFSAWAEALCPKSDPGNMEMVGWCV